MKVGDKVVCIKGAKSRVMDACIVKGDEYVISGISPCGEGCLVDYTGLYWLLNNFRKIQPKGMSTHASRRLADLFEERDGVPEFHPEEEKHLQEEKVFTEDAEF